MDSWSGGKAAHAAHCFLGAPNLMSAAFQYKGHSDVNERYYKEVHMVNEESRFKGTAL